MEEKKRNSIMLDYLTMRTLIKPIIYGLLFIMIIAYLAILFSGDVEQILNVSFALIQVTMAILVFYSCFLLFVAVVWGIYVLFLRNKK